MQVKKLCPNPENFLQSPMVNIPPQYLLSVKMNKLFKLYRQLKQPQSSLQLRTDGRYIYIVIQSIIQ